MDRTAQTLIIVLAKKLTRDNGTTSANANAKANACLLYTSDAADEL